MKYEFLLQLDLWNTGLGTILTWNILVARVWVEI